MILNTAAVRIIGRNEEHNLIRGSAAFWKLTEAMLEEYVAVSLRR